MRLIVYPEAEAKAAENMAEDLLLLESSETPEDLRFRHYGWSQPNSFTFGYSQKHDWVKQAVPVDDPVLVRRPTGGGIVDHRDDWTYAFVIPASHRMHRERGEEVYRMVHQALADALTANGQEADLAPDFGKFGKSGLCFAAPEPFDAILKGTLTKIAGAAMKRNRHGLLIQGSIERAKAPNIQNWDTFGESFIENLTDAFEAEETQRIDHPPLHQHHPDTVSKFTSDAWNRKR